jgi:hypothetical protein
VTDGRVTMPRRPWGDRPGEPVNEGVVLASDDVYATTTAPATATAYQRFEIQVPANPGVETVSVQWEGRVTRGQEAVLSAWDGDAMSWKPLASQPVTGNIDATLTGEVELDQTDAAVPSKGF